MIQQQKAKFPVCNKLKNHKSKYRTETDEDDLELPALIVMQGMRGSGKTYAAVMLAKHFEKKKYVQRSFLICPNVDKKPERDIYLANLSTLEEDDVCTDENKFETAIAQVVERVKQDWDEFEQYETHVKAYTKMLKADEPLTDEEHSILMASGGMPPLREKKLKRHLLILDDCQGTHVYNQKRASPLTHLSIRHRHIPITILYLVQSWTGVPRTIRLNATHYCIFKTSDLQQLEQIYSSFANTVEKNIFMQLYREATDDAHGFLFIDVVPKKEYMRFRKGFDTYLIPSELRNQSHTVEDPAPEKKNEEDEDSRTQTST